MLTEALLEQTGGLLGPLVLASGAYESVRGPPAPSFVVCFADVEIISKHHWHTFFQNTVIFASMISKTMNLYKFKIGILRNSSEHLITLCRNLTPVVKIQI